MRLKSRLCRKLLPLLFWLPVSIGYCLPPGPYSATDIFNYLHDTTKNNWRIQLIAPVPTYTPLPTAIPTSTPLSTNTPIIPPTVTPEPTNTPRPTHTPAPTTTPTRTPTAIPTITQTPTTTPTPTITPTPVPTATPTCCGITAESDPLYTGWITGPPNISEFTNDSGYLNIETDPFYTGWIAGPPNVSEFTNDVPYLTVETDPIYSGDPAAGIAAGDITNWDTAYGWGDHSLIGYLTVEVDGSTSNELQNLWETIATDGTSIAANSQTDTLTIAGGGINVTSQVGDTIIITGTEIDPAYTAWLAGPPNISEFTNDSGYLASESDTLDSVCDRGATTDQTIAPSSNDAAALGIAAIGGWSDLFLAAGGIINWDNGDTRLVHSDNVGLTLSCPAITSAGSNDYGYYIIGELNDSSSAGGIQTYRGLDVSITPTDDTGWDYVYLMDLRNGTNSRFRVDPDGGTMFTISDAASKVFIGNSNNPSDTVVSISGSTMGANTDILDVNGTWGNTDVGHNTGLISSITSGGMTTVGNNITAVAAAITNSVSDIAYSALIGFAAASPTDNGGSADMIAYVVNSGYDISFATVNSDMLIMPILSGEGNGAKTKIKGGDAKDIPPFGADLNGGKLILFGGAKTNAGADGYVKVGEAEGTPNAMTADDDDLYVVGNIEADGMIYADGGVTGALTGNADTCTTASAGDAAVDFFGAGVTAVTDATACTDIEGTLLSITAGTLNCTEAQTLDAVCELGGTTDVAITLSTADLDTDNEYRLNIIGDMKENTVNHECYLALLESTASVAGTNYTLIDGLAISMAGNVGDTARVYQGIELKDFEKNGGNPYETVAIDIGIGWDYAILMQSGDIEFCDYAATIETFRDDPGAGDNLTVCGADGLAAAAENQDGGLLILHGGAKANSGADGYVKVGQGAGTPNAMTADDDDLYVVGDIENDGNIDSAGNITVTGDIELNGGNLNAHISSLTITSLEDGSGTITNIASGGTTWGTAEIDSGALTMINGAQTGDPQVQMALSGGANGNFGITADTGDITLTATGGDVYFSSCEVGIGVADPSDKLEVYTAGSDSAIKVKGTFEGSGIVKFYEEGEVEGEIYRGDIGAQNGGMAIRATEGTGTVYVEDDLYVYDNCSALTFTDRSSAYTGADALAEINKIKAKDNAVSIDGFADLDKTSLPRACIKELQKGTGEVELSRDIGKTLSLLVKAVQELTEKVEKLEKK